MDNPESLNAALDDALARSRITVQRDWRRDGLGDAVLQENLPFQHDKEQVMKGMISHW